MPNDPTREFIFLLLLALGLLALLTHQGLLLALVLFVFLAEGVAWIWRKYGLVGLTYESIAKNHRL
ncbi:MAG: hypothetical protein M1553_08430, partial [Firmicutes bacterium]|nr:hypothetical protein [Bacillota bacterium]